MFLIYLGQNSISFDHQSSREEEPYVISVTGTINVGVMTVSEKDKLIVSIKYT